MPLATSGGSNTHPSDLFRATRIELPLDEYYHLMGTTKSHSHLMLMYL